MWRVCGSHDYFMFILGMTFCYSENFLGFEV